MRILMLGSGSIHSSLTHRALSLGRELVKRGHTVTILVPAADKYNKFQADTEREIDGVHIVYPLQFKTTSALLNLLPYILSASFEVLRRPADTIYLYKPTPISIPGLLGKWLRGKPVFTDLDDLGSEVMAVEGAPSFMVKLVAFCENLAVRQARGLIVASTFLKELHQDGIKPVLRLPNGVNASEFPRSTETHAPRIIFFGALGRVSLLAPAIQAVAKLKHRSDIEMHVLGEGSARPELETLARKLNVSDRITFHGWTRPSDVATVASPGDIGLCIMPAERTTAACSNQKVFQYMALGLAPIVSRVGDLPLYVENGQAGLVVEPGNPEAIARAIAELLDKPDHRQAIVHRGTELATSRYAWSELASQLEVFIRGGRRA